MRSSSPSSASFSTTARSLATPLSPHGEAPSDASAPGDRPSWPRSQSSSTRLAQWSTARRSNSMSQSTGQLPDASFHSGGSNPGSPALQRVGSASAFDGDQRQPWYTKAVNRGLALGKAAWRLFVRLSVLQQLLVGLVGLGMLAGAVVLLVYGERFYAWLYTYAEQWAEVPGGWALLWAFIVATAFPPMMGYSTAVTMCGFIYGMKGWFIAATANVFGSTLSFLVFRRYLSNISTRLTARDGRFQAFNLVLQRDGLPLLIAIRLCPLPYSLSNAGLSTLPPVRVVPFAIATAAAAPKLLIHVFIGGRLAAIAHDERDGSDPGAKLANYLGIAGGVAFGIATGVIIYRRTVARARQLETELAAEEEEGLAAGFQEDEGGNNELGAIPPKRAEGTAAQGAAVGIGPGLEHPDAFADQELEDDAWGHNDDEERREGRDEIDFLELDGAKTEPHKGTQ